MPDLSQLSVAELLSLHARVAEELRERGVLRTANNPTGDLAEYLFCAAFGWVQAPNSERGFDATDADGTRYQIKARRLHQPNTSRQLSAIRNLDAAQFDVLAGLLFDARFGILKAALIPHRTILDRAVYGAHTNSHKFMLTDDVWSLPGVRDVTAEVAAAMP